MNRRISAWFSLAALLALTAGCEESITGAFPEAQLRLVHISPGAPNVDFVIDDEVVLANVAFKDAASYLTVPSGKRHLEVRVTGTTTTVIDISPRISPGAASTLLAAGPVAELEPLLLQDDPRAPSAGKFKLRIVHGAPSAPEVDVYITAPGANLAASTPALEDVRFPAVGAYLEGSAGSFQVRMTVANTTNTIVDTGMLDFAAGQIGTCIAVDAPGGGDPFSALVLNDPN